MICVSLVGGVGCHLPEFCSAGFTAALPKIKSYSADAFKSKQTRHGSLNCRICLVFLPSG